ncbi:unnamed protein product [Closterium sp. NIES-64]|nr:unnamed protein product [Closterium sp. NIES-64]
MSPSVSSSSGDILDPVLPPSPSHSTVPPPPFPHPLSSHLLRSPSLNSPSSPLRTPPFLAPAPTLAPLPPPPSTYLVLHFPPSPPQYPHPSPQYPSSSPAHSPFPGHPHQSSSAAVSQCSRAAAL